MLHAQCIQQAHPQAISHKYYVGLECYQNESFFLESHNWCIPYQDNDVIAKVCSQSQPSTVHFQQWGCMRLLHIQLASRVPPQQGPFQHCTTYQAYHTRLCISQCVIVCVCAVQYLCRTGWFVYDWDLFGLVRLWYYYYCTSTLLCFNIAHSTALAVTGSFYSSLFNSH